MTISPSRKRSHKEIILPDKGGSQPGFGIIQHDRKSSVVRSPAGGYRDDNKFYEVIPFIQLPHPELTSSSLESLPASTENTHWLQLKFALTINPPVALDPSEGNVQTTIDDLILILNEDLEVVDENWLIDVHSPYVLFN